MVFDAHARAFAFCGGVCTRGIYDNMTSAVDAVLLGKERDFMRVVRTGLQRDPLPRT